MQEALSMCPLRVCTVSQAGIDQILHSPLQDAVAANLELGENWQNEIGLTSPI